MAVLNLIAALLYMIFYNLYEKADYTLQQNRTEENEKKRKTYLEISDWLEILLFVLNLSIKTLLNYLLCILYCLTKQAKEEANTCQFVL